MVLAGLALALAGCELTYTGAPTGPGSATFQLNRPFTVPGSPGMAPAGVGGGALPPPANLEGTGVGENYRPLPPAPAQGRYDGTSEVIYGGMNRDCGPLDLTDFRVEGSTLHFGPFIGRIKPDGSVAMEAGPRYISGQFSGSHFQGRYWAPPPACTFSLSFDPVG
jgi:hypothetical protein